MDSAVAFYQRCFPNGCKLIYNGKVYIFNGLGKFEREDILLPMHYNGSAQVNVLSVLSTVNSLELGVSVGRVFHGFTVRDCQVEMLLTSIFGYGKFINSLTRTGAQDGIKYSQGLFVYPCDVDVVAIVRHLKDALKFKLEVVNET